MPMRNQLFICAVIAIGVSVWFFLGIQELSNTGDPDRMDEINIAVAEYAATVEPPQAPEVRTWYFSKAFHYISEFALVDPTSGQTVEYRCSWPENESEVDFIEICLRQSPVVFER